MHAPVGNVPSSHPVLMRLLVRSWEYRRPRLAVGVRIASGIFNVVLGVVLLASAPWTGPLAVLGLLPTTAGCGPSCATWSPDQPRARPVQARACTRLIACLGWPRR
jgi:hypothetical protein